MIDGTVNLRGIVYRVSRPDERTVAFTEDQPIGNRPTRFMLHKPKMAIWNYHFGDGWGDNVSCSCIAAAHKWACKHIAGDHDELPQPHGGKD